MLYYYSLNLNVIHIIRSFRTKMRKKNSISQEQNLRSQLELARHRIQFLETHDPVTQLENRHSFELQLQNTLGTYADQKHAVILLDIDNFRHVIDLYGYSAQLELLKQIGDRIQTCLKPGDCLARQESDKFMICLQNVESKICINRQIKSIQERIAKPFHIQTQAVHLSASIGISLFPQHTKICTELIHYAHIACHFAKIKGKNNSLYFIRPMGKHTRHHTQIDSQLHLALTHKEFKLHFQPQVDTNNYKTLGFEALLRWNNPELGNVSPTDFIPVAEQNGLIFPISQWVLEQACKQLSHWHKEHPYLQISINISPLEFQVKPSTLLKRISSIIQQNHLNPSCVELELTESSIIKNYTSTLPILHALRAMGIRIACDDFGIGHSSLPYLKHLPIDTLKIDKSFIDDIENLHSAAITRAIIVIAKQLNIRVIAEGAEKLEQVNILKDLGCHIIQGYYFSKPLPADKINFK